MNDSLNTPMEGIMCFFQFWMLMALIAGCFAVAIFIGETINYQIDGNCENTEAFYHCKEEPK